MTWEQKIQACQALTGGFSLYMRKPGDWYVSHGGVSRRTKNTTEGGCISAKTPEEAVNQYWDWVSSADETHCIEVRYAGSLRHVRWNCFMWRDVEPPK